ncbi:hypothetical protein [Bdellovibrio svalbardensis]|uniref:Uncharacterized protein n=1 Tax=Bdellovibrio svalbardensis TaxID=2972972 RepID=A0ABT6DLE4_9BACT|nr:hypothetical protein [Bdellovibrio svalbardensis]MDG0817695.1 hypothetical protein [Bdellovibrio svalbardensis]
MPETSIPPQETVKPEVSPKSPESASKISGQSAKEQTIEQKITGSWNKRDGVMSEVIDSEGHRVHINHY